MSIINSQPLIGASGQQGYTIAKSLRFRSSASANLSRTPASSGNQKTWTFSTWVKRGQLGVTQQILTSRYPTVSWFVLGFTSNDVIEVAVTAGSAVGSLTNAVFRDPSAWYHIVLAFDTTQATAANRVKLYVNNVQQTFASTNYPALNTDYQINQNVQHTIGGYSGEFFDGYQTEINLIDGQALTPSSFGETSASTGVWIPKKYTGTYGTNGFYLDFKDTSSVAALGYDAAGSNDWTVNNVSLTSGATYDSMKDVPTLTDTDTANYAVMNPVIRQYSSVDFVSDGNLKYTVGSNGGATDTAVSTMAMISGKWYAEVTITTAVSSQWVGVSSNIAASGLGTFGSGVRNPGYAYKVNTGNKCNNDNNGTAYAASSTTGDIIGIAMDADAGSITFYKNGTSLGVAFTGMTNSGGGWLFGCDSDPNGAFTWNFGQRPFAYTPPSGFKALNTYNLPTPTIGATASSQANKYFDASLYTGNGSARSITGLGFQPDFVWIKSRSNAYYHRLADAVRGVGKELFSNATDAETTNDANGYVSAFNSDGFSFPGGGVGVNGNTLTYVAWNWKANGAGSTNTAGTITSTVSANTTAGFSIVTYTGTGANATVGHGLGVAPSMVIVKSRTGGTLNWAVYHTSLGTNNTVFLDSTSGSVSSTQYWNTAPTSSVFGIGTANLTNTNASNFVAYCFAEVAGYSKFGSYTGNGSTDGTFVFTNFRPKFIICKRTDSTGFWTMLDSSRSTFNVIDDALYANASNAESTPAQNVDFLSNGFKFRSTDSDTNSNGGTHVYMAFAENPFKYSLAR